MIGKPIWRVTAWSATLPPSADDFSLTVSACFTRESIAFLMQAGCIADVHMMLADRWYKGRVPKKNP